MKIRTIRHILTISLAVSVAANVTAGEGLKTIQSEISRVTVYRNGAYINRTAAITLQKGETTLELPGLSPYINEQSVQVKGRGNITILSVSSEKNYLDNLEEPERLKILRKQLQSIVTETGNHEMKIGLLKEQESFLMANKVVSGKDQSLEAGNFKTLYDFYSSNMKQVREGILETSRVVDSLREQQKNIQQEINQLQSARKLPSGLIKIVVKATGTGEAQFDINYMVTNAGWYPSYDIRIDNPKEPARLIYKANVFQQTGVEWKNVKLTFSNATPARSGNVPVLYPWYIDFVPDDIASVRPYARSAKKAANDLEESNVDLNKLNIMAPAELPEASTVVTERAERTTSVEFNVDIPYTISPSNKPKSIDMMRLSLPASYQYKSVPRIENAAFLVAGIHDWGEYDLLPGEASIYFENTYVGKSSLDVQNVKDTLDISLGRDPGIVVKREKQRDVTSDQFIGGNRIENRSWEISVRNNKSYPVQVRLEDQVPVSKNKDITVDPVRLSGGSLNETTGIVHWTLDIKPGETKTVTFGYSVKYPKDKNISL